jgi:mannosyltransferase OCH1-like enzyme
VNGSGNDNPALVGQVARPIVQYWHEPEPPDYITRLLETFAEHNPDMDHLVFNKDGARELIAARFGTRELAAFDACAPAAMQADYFRYCAIFAFGGIYSDADLRCRASCRSLILPGGCGRLFQGPRGNVINGVFAFGSPGHPFLELTLEIATQNIEQRLCNRVYWIGGPPIFTVLTNLAECGSFEALMYKTRNHHRRRRAYLKAYCKAIGDYRRVITACQGIEVCAAGGYADFIRGPGIEFPHKKSSAHWANWKGSIFQ